MRVKLRFALMLLALTLLLGGCGYWLVEDAPITVGSEVHIVTPAP